MTALSAAKTWSEHCEGILLQKKNVSLSRIKRGERNDTDAEADFKEPPRIFFYAVGSQTFRLIQNSTDQGQRSTGDGE